jgi:hypothetical protein
MLTSLGFALMLVVVNESPVWGARRGVVATTTGNATGGGALLLAMGAGVLILGGGGFTILTWSRRKRKPQQCATEREALEMAEQALRYWEGALLHLQSATRGHGDTATDAASAVGAGPESQASLLEKATAGHASALKTRDERQLDVIRCMASGSTSLSASSPTPRLEPVVVESERPSAPPTTFE